MRDTRLPTVNIAIPNDSVPQNDDLCEKDLETPVSSVAWTKGGQSDNALVEVAQDSPVSSAHIQRHSMGCSDYKATRSAGWKTKDLSEESTETKLINATQAKPEATVSYILEGKRLAVVMGAMILSILCLSLDQTILATALPQIGSDLDAFDKQAWISGAYILTQTASLLLIAQSFRIFPAKYVLLTCVTIFEVGSIISGSATNVNALITGRAISGVGAAGAFSAVLQVVAQSTLLKDRSRLMGWIFGSFSASAILGPLIGGAFNDHASWRWCFYLNLPLGGVTLVTIFFLVPAAPPMGSDPAKRSRKSLLQQTLRMDWIGALLILGAVTCLALALEWGGNTKAWNASAVIVTFVLTGVTTAAFVLWDLYRGDTALVPKALFKSLSVPAIVAYAFLIRVSHLILSYWLPIYYQAGRQASATSAGIKILPFMIATVAVLTGASQVTAKTGRYWHYLVAGPIFLAIGSGLLYTINEFSSVGRVFGYQILVGIGIGFSIQTSTLAMQAEFYSTPALIGQATGLVTFAQFLGGTVGLALAESIFSSSLSSNLLKYAPEISSGEVEVIRESPTFIYTSIPKGMVPAVAKGYVESLKFIFITGVPVGGLCIVLALLIKNINLKAPASKKDVEAAPTSASPVKVEATTKQADSEKEVEIISVPCETPEDEIK